MSEDKIQELIDSLNKLDDELKQIKLKLQREEKIVVYGPAYILIYNLCIDAYNRSAKILRDMKIGDRMRFLVRIPTIVVTDYSDAGKFENKVEMNNSIIWFK